MTAHDSSYEEDPAEATAAGLLREADLVTKWPDEVIRRRKKLIYGTEAGPVGVNLPPERRAKIADRLDDILAARRLEHGPLPALLLFQRQQHGLSRQVVAADNQVADPAVDEAEQLRGFETGELSARDVPPEVLVRWVHVVGIDDDVAVHAMRQALLMDTPLSFAAGAAPGGEVALSEPDERLVGEFRERLTGR